MADFQTPNLASRDFDTTVAFFATLGFSVGYRDSGWLILRRGSLCLEFFLFAGLDAEQSNFGACLRLDDLDGFYAKCVAAGVPVKNEGAPRLHPPKTEHWGGRRAALLDPDFNLLHLIQND
ncbi:bleomycin resistance protein [Sphingomonas humi]|uniref:Bleomycin resistance protein n=1 Tax=Sphingomonas humi TaxID=335630 RepID=A0ABP7S8Q9_9SPHN